MNEIFEKKSAIFYVISQNNIKKHKKMNPSIGHLSPVNNEYNLSQKLSFILQNYKTNKNYNRTKLNSSSFSSNMNILNDLSNTSEMKSINNLNQFTKKNIAKGINNILSKHNNLINNSNKKEKNK